jgi:hypothetical protein
MTEQRGVDGYDGPRRLAPFLAQWDYIAEVLFDRLRDLTDDEFLWQPATDVWTIRMVDGQARPDVEAWPPTGDPAPPRTLAWSIDHLAAGCLIRADWLVGRHALESDDLEYPMTADAGIDFLRRGLDAWRSALDQMTDDDLDTVGRSAYPHGRDPSLPLIEIVWWMSRELIFHVGEIWYARDLYAALGGNQPTR